MTRPMTGATEKVLRAMARGRTFKSMRDIGVAAGLLVEPVKRDGAQLRLAQRTVTRMVMQGMISRRISSAKVDNSYVLSRAGRTIAATLYADAISPKPRTEQQHPEHPS